MPLLVACFVVSGASGLVLQVVWSRQLVQVFGSTSLAISTVLATFMGGLALGSWLGGRFADRMRGSPLGAYAVCELAIALLALAIPVVLLGYPDANAWLWRRLGHSPALLALARFALSAALLLPPTTLMGATLPLLARHVVRRRADLGLVGRRVGALYAANTFGAVLGAGGAGFYLLPTIGVRRTNLVAVIADVLIALAILAATARRRRPSEAELVGAADVDVDLDAAVAPPPAPALPDRDRRFALVAFSMSGFVAMTLEVLWSRALALVIGSSVYSFTLVLVVFLFGLAAGAAWIGRPAARAADPLGALAIALLGVGASVGLAHLVIDDLPRVFLSLLEGTTGAVGTVMGFHTVVAGLAVLPTSLCLGAVMPLVIRAYAGSVDAVGSDVGRAYAANTVGAIAGSFAGGFLVLPWIGLERGVRGCALADLGLAILLAQRAKRPRVRAAVTGVAAVLAAWVILAPRWDARVLTAGVFRMTVAKRYVRSGNIGKHELVYYRDGVATTVTVERHGDRIALKNNGKVEASSVGDMPTQVLVGLAPVLLHGGERQKVFVIGYGSGVTVGAIAESPSVERVDVVEIEPAVYEAADLWFGPYNHEAHRNPRVRRFVGDGRNFLLSTPERYDVIVSEPSNPWIAGVSSLFSAEFYAFAKRHLAEDGVFCQWAQLYELGPRNVKTIYRTFQEAFPYVYAFTAADLSADTFLVGSLRPLPLDVAALEARVAVPSVRAELERGGVRSAYDLLAMLMLGPDEVPAFAAGGDLNTDDNGLLEFAAPRDLIAAAQTGRFADAIYAYLWPYGHLDGLVVGLGDGEVRGRRAAALADALVGRGKRREARVFVARARADGAEAEARRVERILALADLRDFTDSELPLDVGGPPMGAPSPDWFAATVPEEERRAAAEGLRRVLDLCAAADWDGAWRAFAALPAPADSPEGRDVRLLRGYILYKTLLFDDAKEVLAPLAEDEQFLERRPAALYYYGRVVYGDGEFSAGAALLDRFADRWPDLVPL